MSQDDVFIFFVNCRRSLTMSCPRTCAKRYADILVRAPIVKTSSLPFAKQSHYAVSVRLPSCLRATGHRFAKAF